MLHGLKYRSHDSVFKLYFTYNEFGFSNSFTHQKNGLPSTQCVLKPDYVIRNAQKRCSLNTLKKVGKRGSKSIF
jgi:hypothetical protein